MSDFDERTQANMDVVLEEVCRELSKHGGDHDSRRFIATRLIETARAGRRTLHDLRFTAKRALLDLTRRNSA
jgi:hypothetical protein